MLSRRGATPNNGVLMNNGPLPHSFRDVSLGGIDSSCYWLVFKRRTASNRSRSFQINYLTTGAFVTWRLQLLTSSGVRSRLDIVNFAVYLHIKERGV